MRLPISFLLLLWCSACGSPPATDEWLPGDIIFQSTGGSRSRAIEEVTEGIDGRALSHVGLLVVDSSGRRMVIEAIGDRVQLTALDSFLRRDALNLWARVNDEYRSLVPAAIAFAWQQLGVPYDDEYLYDNGKYYCSELIYDAFLFANHGRPFFELAPMTFRSPVTGEVSEEWLTHYRQLGLPVPEGAPGCNPGGLSRSEKIKIKRIRN
jgi:hypothetical protein